MDAHCTVRFTQMLIEKSKEKVHLLRFSLLLCGLVFWERNTSQPSATISYLMSGPDSPPWRLGFWGCWGCLVNHTCPAGARCPAQADIEGHPLGEQSLQDNQRGHTFCTRHPILRALFTTSPPFASSRSEWWVLFQEAGLPVGKVTTLSLVGHVDRGDCLVTND